MPTSKGKGKGKGDGKGRGRGTGEGGWGGERRGVPPLLFRPPDPLAGFRGAYF